MKTVKPILSLPIARYIIVGGVSYIVEVGILYGLQTINIHPLLAVTIAFWVGLTIAFLLQKVIAFQDKHTSPKKIASQTTMYMALVGFNYIFTLGLVHVLEPYIGLIIARTIALAITTIWNYILYSKVIFKR